MFAGWKSVDLVAREQGFIREKVMIWIYRLILT